MHTTLIRRVVVDAARNRLITASDDKTIRVWQMPEARLVKVLRVPIDSGHEGQLFGLAVSPDGQTVAAGGWTGWDWEGQGSIYLFDVASGDLVKRFGGLNETIGALAWSPDGQYLAVGLQGRGGFRVLQADTGSVVATDPQYGDKLQDIAFSPQGRIVTVALDGMVRLYDRTTFRLIGRRVVPGRQQADFDSLFSRRRTACGWLQRCGDRVGRVGRRPVASVSDSHRRCHRSGELHDGGVVVRRQLHLRGRGAQGNSG